MAKVYEVAVRFMRKVQVKEYEPVEAEVSLKAQTEDGEDHVAVLATLGADARTAALDMIRGTGKVTPGSGQTTINNTVTVASADDLKKANGKTADAIEKEIAKSNGKAAASDIPEETGEPTPAPAKSGRGRPAGSKNKKAEAAAAAASDMPDEDAARTANIDAAAASDMPDDGPPAGTSPTGVSDIPDETSTQAEDWEKDGTAEEPVTAADLTKFISQRVSAGKITVPEVKAILARYGGARCAELKPADLPKAKAEIADFSRA
jgi:hypothetical protein